MFNPTFSTCVSAESLTPSTFGLYSFLAASTHTQMRCVWENNELYFCHNSRPKKKEGSCVMSRVAVLLRIHPWSWKRGVFYQWKCRERARERRVCVSLCWWQWECLFLGPPPPLQIYSTSLPNAQLRSPAPPTARPNTHSVFFILSFSQSHSSLCSLSSSWPRLPLALPARELETYRNEAVERERGEIELGTSAHT